MLICCDHGALTLGATCFAGHNARKAEIVQTSGVLPSISARMDCSISNASELPSRRAMDHDCLIFVASTWLKSCTASYLLQLKAYDSQMGLSYMRNVKRTLQLHSVSAYGSVYGLRPSVHFQKRCSNDLRSSHLGAPTLNEPSCPARLVTITGGRLTASSIIRMKCQYLLVETMA